MGSDSVQESLKISCTTIENQELRERKIDNKPFKYWRGDYFN